MCQLGVEQRGEVKEPSFLACPCRDDAEQGPHILHPLLHRAHERHVCHQVADGDDRLVDVALRLVRHVHSEVLPPDETLEEGPRLPEAHRDAQVVDRLDVPACPLGPTTGHKACRRVPEQISVALTRPIRARADDGPAIRRCQPMAILIEKACAETVLPGALEEQVNLLPSWRNKPGRAQTREHRCHLGAARRRNNVVILRRPEQQETVPRNIVWPEIHAMVESGGEDVVARRLATVCMAGVVLDQVLPYLPQERFQFRVPFPTHAPCVMREIGRDIEHRGLIRVARPVGAVQHCFMHPYLGAVTGVEHHGSQKVPLLANLRHLRVAPDPVLGQVSVKLHVESTGKWVDKDSKLVLRLAQGGDDALAVHGLGAGSSQEVFLASHRRLRCHLSVSLFPGQIAMPIVVAKGPLELLKADFGFFLVGFLVVGRPKDLGPV
mmetsp:Transcript_73367/g.212514  ORF Transcript_73367/g.212514 Transcript_73367/m.212514 type:complete len:437 (+) Transcript_73367:86-1396(+)